MFILSLIFNVFSVSAVDLFRQSASQSSSNLFFFFGIIVQVFGVPSTTLTILAVVAGVF